MEKFPLGQTVITPNAEESLDVGSVATCIGRHVSGDWGDVDDEDKATNNEALILGNRVVSAYKDSQGVKFWIITERDRSVTTVLLPEDY